MTQVGKSNMMDWNVLLTDGDAGVIYKGCFTGNVISYRTATCFIMEFSDAVTEYYISAI